MATNLREVVEGEQIQGEDEQIAYVLDVSSWGTNPTSPAVVVKDANGTAVTSDVMPTNSPTVSGNAITLSTLKSLTARNRYRVEVKFTVQGNVLEAFFIVVGDKNH